MERGSLLQQRFTDCYSSVPLIVTTARFTKIESGRTIPIVLVKRRRLICSVTLQKNLKIYCDVLWCAVVMRNGQAAELATTGAKVTKENGTRSRLSFAGISLRTAS